jgi:hypothetical protein
MGTAVLLPWIKLSLTRDFLLQVFFVPLSISLGPFRMVVHGDVCNFVFIAGVNHTGDMLFTGANNTGDN